MHRTHRILTVLLLVVLIAGWLPGAAAPPVARAAQLAPAAPAASAPAALPAPPVSLPQLPAPVLELSVAPNPVVVGESATITLTVTNRAPVPAAELVITMPTPEGALALPGPGTVGPTQGWRWSPGALAG